MAHSVKFLSLDLSSGSLSSSPMLGFKKSVKKNLLKKIKGCLGGAIG